MLLQDLWSEKWVGIKNKIEVRDGGGEGALIQGSSLILGDLGKPPLIADTVTETGL